MHIDDADRRWGGSATATASAADDIPELVLSPLAERPRRSRREALKVGAAVVAGAVAASTFRVLGSPLPAGASGPGMRRHPGKNAYGSGVGSACLSDRGCIGPPAHLIDPWFCSTCDEYRANHNNYIGFMYTGGRNGNTILDDHPDRFCSGDYDYWIHDGEPCGYCPFGIEYRCHDGIKYTADTPNGEFVICHSVYRCNGNYQSTAC